MSGTKASSFHREKVNLLRSSTMQTLVLYLSLFHLLLYIAASTKNPQPYTPTDYFLLNCGSTSNSTFFDGRNWEDDSKFSSPDTLNASLASNASLDYPSVTQVPYMTARIFHSKSTYSFNVSAGPKFIRLYFHPATYAGFDKTISYFSVTSNGFKLLSNFSAFLTVSGKSPPDPVVIKEFVINVQNNQRLNITFIPLPNSYAFINGIEVVSMPNNLYQDRNVNFVGISGIYDNTTALETVYRVNVGSQSISGESDTGMFRIWEDDVAYIFGAAIGQTPYLPNITIQYTEGTPAYTAPEIVYTTYRTMGRDPYVNLNYNLTWLFPVDVGFLYLVRLHFCETQLEVKRQNQRVFTIFINNQTAEEQADVIYWAGGSNIPVYKDYIVSVPNERPGKQDLLLELHPNIRSKPSFASAILNGVEIFKLNNSDGSLAGPNPDPVPMTPSVETQGRPLTKSTNKRSTRIAIIGGAISGVALLSILGLVAFQLSKRAKDVGSTRVASWWGLFPFTKTKSTKTEGSSLPSELCRNFSFVEIQAATNDFDEVLIIGVGGFGNVYKGHIDEGTTPVAIKRLKSSSQQGAHEFHTEIAMLSQLRHRHLVSLIGYCNDAREMILVYDFMARGTLRDHLYDTDNPPLSWKQRLEICTGAARGLNYLHTDTKHMVIHRDVKTTNILLDDKWVAKVSDFGLSKIGPNTMSKTHVSTVVKGSMGYMDPEYYRLQQLTEKSDVYSFGVVLFEVLCARPPLLRTAPEKNQVSLAQWALECYRNKMLDQIVDPFLKGAITPACLEKFGEMAGNCLLDDGIKRPSMNEVVWGLEFALQMQESANDINSLRGETKGPLFQELAKGDSDGVFTSSSEGVSSAKSSSLSMTSSGEANFANKDTDCLLSGTVFSQLKDARGR